MKGEARRTFCEEEGHHWQNQHTQKRQREKETNMQLNRKYAERSGIWRPKWKLPRAKDTYLSITPPWQIFPGAWGRRADGAKFVAKTFWLRKLSLSLEIESKNTFFTSKTRNWDTWWGLPKHILEMYFIIPLSAHRGKIDGLKKKRVIKVQSDLLVLWRFSSRLKVPPPSGPRDDFGPGHP